MKAITFLFICVMWIIALAGFIQSILMLRFDTMAGSVLLGVVGVIFLGQLKELDEEEK